MKKHESAVLLQEEDSQMAACGRHLLVEFYGCGFNVLNDKEKISQTLVDSVKAAGATLINLFVYQFSPHGITGVATLSESHISIHTWPERNYAAIDIFMCGSSDPYRTLKSLISVLKPTSNKIKEVNRGIVASCCEGHSPLS